MMTTETRLKCIHLPLSYPNIKPETPATPAHNTINQKLPDLISRCIMTVGPSRRRRSEAGVAAREDRLSVGRHLYNLNPTASPRFESISAIPRCWSQMIVWGSMIPVHCELYAPQSRCFSDPENKDSKLILSLARQVIRGEDRGSAPLHGESSQPVFGGLHRANPCTCSTREITEGGVHVADQPC